ncbi:MAG: hydrolase [Candidatus Poribacteria bacterium]
MSFGIIKRDDCFFLLIDIQEKFLPVIYDIQGVIDNANRLIQGASILDIPLLVTEQYPKGLGRTVDEIKLENDQQIIEKISFDCFACDEFVNAIDQINRKTIVIFGIEAHVCVLKTALSALSKSYEVHLIADAVSSRTQRNRDIAIERMRQSGVFIASTEMILFQLMEKAGTDEFKAISKLVK